MSTTFITRRRHGKAFRYFENAAPVDTSIAKRIDALAIPPAWKDVRIAKSTKSKVQASGIDTAGRKQYIYSERHRAAQEKAKFDRITSFGIALPRLRKQLETDLKRKKFDKRKVLACAVSLMDEAYFRVGNSQYAKEHQSYGLTTLRSKHLTISGDTAVFDFVGKSGQKQHKKITDRTLSRLVKKLDEMPGHELFRYYTDDGSLQTLTSHDVNSYIKDSMGDSYSAKDFRTWGGTLVATMELAKAARADSERERKKAITQCVKRVAKRLGNTPSVARSSYIDPRVIEHYNKADTIKDMFETISSMRPRKYLTNDERCVMELLS